MADWLIDDRLKPFLNIHFDREMPANLIEEFCEATRLIADYAEPKKLIIFMVHGKLEVQLVVPKCGEYWRDVLVFDVDKILTVPDRRMRIVIWLEELAHALLGILDEDIIARIVARIYPQVRYNEIAKRYEVV